MGQLYSVLKKMNLADDTLLVVTAIMARPLVSTVGRCISLQFMMCELRIPLLIVNERLFPHQSTISSLGSQIGTSPRPFLICWGCPYPSSGKATVCLTDLPPAFTSSHHLVLR